MSRGVVARRPSRGSSTRCRRIVGRPDTKSCSRSSGTRTNSTTELRCVKRFVRGCAVAAPEQFPERRAGRLLRPRGWLREGHTPVLRVKEAGSTARPQVQDVEVSFAGWVPRRRDTEMNDEDLARWENEGGQREMVRLRPGSWQGQAGWLQQGQHEHEAAAQPRRHGLRDDAEIDALWAAYREAERRVRHQPNRAELRWFALAAFYAGWPVRVKHGRGLADVEARMRRWAAGAQPELRELRQALMKGIEERRKLLTDVEQLEGEINEALDGGDDVSDLMAKLDDVGDLKAKLEARHAADVMRRVPPITGG